MNTVTDSVKKFIELHKWFCKHSRTFVGVWSNKPYTPYFKKGWWYTVSYGRYVYRTKDLIYFPIAYLKFMYYSF